MNHKFDMSDIGIFVYNSKYIFLVLQLFFSCIEICLVFCFMY